MDTGGRWIHSALVARHTDPETAAGSAGARQVTKRPCRLAGPPPPNRSGLDHFAQPSLISDNVGDTKLSFCPPSSSRPILRDRQMGGYQLCINLNCAESSQPASVCMCVCVLRNTNTCGWQSTSAFNDDAAPKLLRRRQKFLKSRLELLSAS